MLVRRGPPCQDAWAASAAWAVLPAELAAVDALLDDDAFLAPFDAHFDPVAGRPSTPIETYVRMMWLKYRHGLGYETVCAAVGESMHWRRFCRIAPDGRVPHPTTLMKITSRCGPGVVDQLNEALLAKAHGAKLVRLHKVRMDTTVVEADVEYPTDSRLLAKAVARMLTLVGRIHAAGGAQRTHVRDRRRAVRRRAHQLGASLRRRDSDAKGRVTRLNAELVALARTVAADAERVVRNATRAARRRGSRRLAALTAQLRTIIARTRRIADQTTARLAGVMPDGAIGGPEPSGQGRSRIPYRKVGKLDVTESL